MNSRLIPHPLTRGDVPPLGPPLQPGAADSEAAPLDFLDALSAVDRAAGRVAECNTFGTEDERRAALDVQARVMDDLSRAVADLQDPARHVS